MIKTEELYTKMRNGDWLTDEEVVYMFHIFDRLSVLLSELGDTFHLARVEATQRANQLHDWYLSRTGLDLT